MRTHGRAIAALPLRDPARGLPSGRAAMTIIGDGRATVQSAILHFSVPETIRPVFLTLGKDVAVSASKLNRTAVVARPEIKWAAAQTQKGRSVDERPP